MADQTTIKVPTDLRDRIAARALAERVTFATAISRALDLADERAFWSQVHDQNASLTDDERNAYVSDPTSSDNLADSADDALSAADAW